MRQIVQRSRELMQSSGAGGVYPTTVKVQSPSLASL